MPTPLEILTANAAATRLDDAKYEGMTLKTRDATSALMDQKDFCLLSKLYTVSSQYRWDVMWRVSDGANTDLRCLIKQQLVNCSGIQQWLCAGVNLPVCGVSPLDPWAVIPRSHVRYLDFMLPDVAWISPTRLSDSEATTGPGTTPSATCYVIDVRYLNGQSPGGFIAVPDAPIAVTLHQPFWFKIWIDQTTHVEYRIEEYTANDTLLRVITADQSDWNQIGTTGKYWCEERNFYDIASSWTSQLTNGAPDTSSISSSVFDSAFLNSEEFCPPEE